MPRREINPTHDTYTDVMKAKKTRQPLERTYNDEDFGEPKDPKKNFLKIDDVRAEGVDPEALLTSEAGGEVEAEKVAKKLSRAQNADKELSAIRRAAEAKAGWSPKRDKKKTIEPFIAEEAEVPEAAEKKPTASVAAVVEKKDEEARQNELKPKQGKLKADMAWEKRRREETDYWPILEEAVRKFALASLKGTKKKDENDREVDFTPEERSRHYQEAIKLIKGTVGLFESMVEAKRVARGLTWRLNREEQKNFTDEFLAAVGWELKKRKQYQREMKADLSGRDRPKVMEEPAEIGEELTKKEGIGVATVSTQSGEVVRAYGKNKHEQKFLKHHQKDKEKNLRLGQRQKINEVLEIRREFGGERGIEENSASERLKDFFDVHRDALSDGSVTLSEEELLRHGRFTALDFFDFADDLRGASNFASLAKVAGKELRARLARDSDLAEHFLNMVKRQGEVRDIIPHFDDLERVALERVEVPLSPSERQNLEKRYGLVIQEKNEKAAQKGWNRAKLSHAAYVKDQEDYVKAAYKYDPEKVAALRYQAENAREDVADARTLQEDKGLVRRLLYLLRNRRGGANERHPKSSETGNRATRAKAHPSRGFATENRPNL